MQDIKEALRAAMDRGASDVHFSVGRPAMLRIDGKLVPIEEDRLMPADTERLILPVLNEQNIAELKEKGEIDLALSVEGIGRFRINVFMSRGSYAAALRLLPYNIPTPEDLNLPAAVVETTNKKR